MTLSDNFEEIKMKKIKCPICKSKFKYLHACQKAVGFKGGPPCITREWALNPPKKYSQNSGN